MDIKEYRDKKSKGLAEVVRAGGGFAYAAKRFDPEDGTELTPEITSIDIDSLNKSKVSLQAEVEDCDAVIEDINALEKQED